MYRAKPEDNDGQVSVTVLDCTELLAVTEMLARTILSYLVKPLSDQVERAFREE